MRKPLPRMLDLSRELVACESRARQSPNAGAPGTEVCEKLRPKLSTLMGATGFRALLARALALASEEVPSLCNLEIDPRHALVYRHNIPGHTDAPGDVEGGVMLVAQLLSLLVAFIGEKLTRQLLREIWPQSFVNDPKLATGDNA